MLLAHAQEIHEHASLWAEYRDLLTDPAHLLLELTVNLFENVVLGAVLFPLVKRWVRKHDAEVHGVEEA